MKSVYNKNSGVCDRVLRADSIKHQGRYIVRTTAETQFVQTWEEFCAAGGTIHF